MLGGSRLRSDFLSFGNLVEAIGTNHKLLARQDLSLVDKRLRTVASESEVYSNLLVAVF